MVLKIGELKQLLPHLKETIGQRLSKVNQWSDDVFLFHVSKKGYLTFVLDARDPYVYLAEEGLEGNSLASTFSSLLRKHCGNALVTDVELFNEDRIVCFRLKNVNELYKEESYSLIAELIPTKSNLILLDEENKVLGAMRTNLITDPRPIFRGIGYEPPLNRLNGTVDALPFDYPSYLARCLEKEEQLKLRRKKERFSALYRFLQTKRKSIKRKLEGIERDILEASKHIDDGQYGDYIYMNLSSIDPLSKEMDYFGETIPLDPSRSASDNAQIFYKKAKKAKATLAYASENKKKAMEEEEEISQILLTLDLCDEAALDKWSKEYGLDHLHRKESVRSPLGQTAILPFETHFGQTRILFGKTAKQNDFLSFLFQTRKEYLWLHLKGEQGAHVILCSLTPSNEEIQIACEIAVLASSREEGEVMYTQHKNIKRGNVPGLAIVKEYQSTMLRSISESGRKAYENAAKIKLK